jgi:hypothetical protein
MKPTRVSSLRLTALILTGIAGTASVSGCTVKDTVKTTDDLQAAPGIYGNALNRAHDVAGKVERRSAEGIPAVPGEKPNSGE